jgi:hypothetical protein
MVSASPQRLQMEKCRLNSSWWPEALTTTPSSVPSMMLASISAFSIETLASAGSFFSMSDMVNDSG